MFGQKNKLQPPQQAIYEAYDESDAESQPMIEEVDPNYEPTDRQIKQYAIQTLGMVLPRDENQLYLAKEGLKAPLPPNWVPYQSRDGQVYYKHKITQQKTTDHPTDVEYRRKYQQTQQKKAMKNLKSIGLNNKPPPSLTGLGHNPIPSIGVSNLSNLSGIKPQNQISADSSFAPQFTEFSGAGDNTMTLDPDIQLQYEEQLLQLQTKLKRELKQFQQQESQNHNQRLKKCKQEHQQNLKSIFSGDINSAQGKAKELTSLKNQIKEKTEKTIKETYEEDLAEIQRDIEKKINEYEAFNEQDNKLKIIQFQQKRETEFNTIATKFEQKHRKIIEKLRESRAEHQRILQTKREEFEQENNYEISKAIQGSINNKLTEIRQEYRLKLAKTESELQDQFEQMKKILGLDPNQLFREIAQKKQRLKNISLQKMTSMRNKQLNVLNRQSEQQFDRQKSQYLNRNAMELEAILIKQAREQEEKTKNYRQKIDKEFQQKIRRGIQDLEKDNERRISFYQASLNQKIIQIQQQSIKQVENRDRESGLSNPKLQIKDKQQKIGNKEKIIANLKQQIELQKALLKELSLMRQISSANPEKTEAILQKLSRQLHVEYRPQIYIKHKQRLQKMKERYQRDKELLAALMLNLQKNAILPFYQKQKQLMQNYSGIGEDHSNTASSSTAILIRKYNADVRLMRQNQQMLRQYQKVLRKAEINDRASIALLEEQEYTAIDDESSGRFQYKNISLRNAFGVDQESQFDQNNNDKHRVRQLDLSEIDKTMRYAKSYHDMDSVKNVMESHSKFLSNVKSQLNKKLFEIRTQGHSYY